MFVPMGQLLIINADIDKSSTTQALIDAYKEGATAADASIKELAIADLKFNPNKQFSLNNTAEPEADLVQAVNLMKWASHIVVFSPVYKESMSARIKGFFDRIFMPDQVFVTDKNLAANFSGKTARIVSVLDEAAWQDWLESKSPTYVAVKKIVLEKRNIKPVHTSTIGHLYSLDNEYAKKWLLKLNSFGLKLI